MAQLELAGEGIISPQAEQAEKYLGVSVASAD